MGNNNEKYLSPEVLRKNTDEFINTYCQSHSRSNSRAPMTNKWLIDKKHFKDLWNDYQWIYQDEVRMYMRNRCKNIRGKITKYNSYYLTTVWWYIIRHKIKLRDGFKCCDCGEHENLSNLNFHVHHMNGDYKHLGEEILYLDTLQLLCEKCHDKAHGNPPKKVIKKKKRKFNEIILTENVELNNIQRRWTVINNLNFVLEQLKLL